VKLVDIAGTNIKKKTWNNSNKTTLQIFRQAKINLRSVTILEVTWTRRTEVISLQIHIRLWASRRVSWVGAEFMWC